ncbi:hypothetical protein JKY72_00960 [Candidatus Gracilibacteria bacterium]|nr:hypothetical protein [Candidatus Gracilibacteria bacterium]
MKDCSPCKKVLPLLLSLTGLFLLLGNLGVITGGFAEFVMMWWPATLLIMGLAMFCPCHGKS